MMPNVKLLFAFLLLLMFIACMNTSVQLSPKAGEIDALFNALEKDNAFNGAVLVAKKGKVIYKKAFGLGNFEKGERLTVQSVFEIASVSKTFTAVAVHQLVERGALRLDDPLTKFFPKLPYDGVTIRGLLSHTSGLFDVSGIEDLRKQFFAFYNRTEPPYTNKDYLEFLEKFTPPLIGKPGEKSQYSNTGYVLLGLIVEQVSGQSFDEFLRRNIFEPAGMKRTVVFSKLKDKQAANLVGGYRHDPVNGIVPDPDPKAEPRIYGLTYGDDDIVSTVDDMFAYDQALRSGKLLKLETLEGVLIPPTLTDGSVSGYALGFGISAKDGLRYISHGGSTSGFWAFCKFSRPENDSTVILFTNVTSQRRAFSAIYEAINKIMLDQPFAAEPFPHNKQEKQRAPEIL